MNRSFADVCINIYLLSKDIKLRKDLKGKKKLLDGKVFYSWTISIILLLTLSDSKWTTAVMVFKVTLPPCAKGVEVNIYTSN